MIVTPSSFTMTIQWQDRAGVWHTESGPTGYMNSRIQGLLDHNRPVRVANPGSETES
jgi:hypothetical protein